MDTLKDKFFSIYAEVFDEKGNPKTCGRRKCAELTLHEKEGGPYKVHPLFIFYTNSSQTIFAKSNPFLVSFISSKSTKCFLNWRYIGVQTLYSLYISIY